MPAQPEITPDFSPADYRHVLGHVPTSVVVITAMWDGEPAGMAVGSFTSISLEPPLVGFFAAQSSSTLPKVGGAGAFCANVLSSDQEDVCRTFANPDADRFAAVEWSTMASGSPVLDRAVAWVDCTLFSVVPVGDHDLVVGRVLGLDIARPAPPLLFHRGTYTGVS